MSAESPLKRTDWFPGATPPKREGGVTSTLVKLGVGVAFGLILYTAQKPTAAIVVWSIAFAVSAVSLASAKAREAIDGALARFGRWVGRVLGAVILALVYVLVLTPRRFLRWALGADDLHLRDGGRASYWLPCDDDARKVRWAGAMFATEARKESGHPVRTALIVVVLLFALSEGILRTQGFGTPVLYVADPDIGYYPEPGVHLQRYGGLVATNSFGMRSPEVDRDKPPGVFRILMLGDSTLYGGSYVDQEDLYASQLRERLNHRGEVGKVEVLAMGTNGWGPFHERAYVASPRFGTFGADLVLIQMPIDDINRPLYGLMSVPFFAVQQPPHLGLEEVMNHEIWQYRTDHSGLDEAWEQRQSKHGIEEYGHLVDDLQKAGCEVMLFVLPSRSPGLGGPEEPRETKWRGQLSAAVKKRGVTAYFAAGFFVGRGETGHSCAELPVLGRTCLHPDEIYHDNVHLMPKGHRIYAEFLEQTITAESKRFATWSGTEKGPATLPAVNPPR
jgi:hypothetical protein